MKQVTLVSLLPWLSVLSVVMADPDPTHDQYCFEACDTALSGQAFEGSPSAADGYYLELCGNTLHIESLYLCARNYCGESGLAIGFDYLNHVCETYATALPPTSIVNNITADEIRAQPTLEYGDYPESINTTILPSQDLFDLGYRTIDSWYSARTHHMRYCYAMFIFWGIAVFLGIAYNALSALKRRGAQRGDQSHVDRSSSNGSPLLRIWTQVQARFLMPATFGHRCDSVSLWAGTIPPRAESTLIAVYFALNVILCAVSYRPFENNLYYAESNIQIWRYFSDRTGYLAYANLGIFWLFGIRNNILIWLTGWDFATFSRFHRWVARIATLQAILHSIGYTVFSFLEGGLADYAESFAEEYWYTGVIATIAMSLILGFSIPWLRARAYEVFLVVHIVLAIVTLVNLFYHTKIFNGEYNGFLWPCVAFWAFDRLCRIVRTVYALCASGLRQNAIVDYEPDSQLIRVDVTALMRRMKPLSGSHFFIYSPFTWKGWESHPFTLVRWKQETATPATSGSASPTTSAQNKIASATVTSVSQALATEFQYSFIIRPMKGFTSRLARRSLTTSSPTLSTKMLFEGPYGHAPCLDAFDRIIVIIGGSGISVGISCIYDALERRSATGHAGSLEMQLVWTCRKRSMIDSVMKKELKAAATSGSLAVDAFVTQERVQNKEIDESSGELYGCRTIRDHRPVVEDIIHNAALEQRGRLAVVVCGPASLTDDTRAAVIKEMRDGVQDVSLFVEAFAW